VNLGCFVGIPTVQGKIFLTVVSFSAALFFFGIMQRFKLSTKLRVSLIYAHLVTLIFPFVLLTTSTACSLTCSSCYTDLYALIGLSLPTTLTLSTLAGFVLIPSLFVFSNKKNEIRSGNLVGFIRRYSKKLNIPAPKLYAVNKASPVAFSFRSFKSAIFLSVGLFDLLSRKEIESVILHELAHARQKSSIVKFSNHVLNVFSPVSMIARFNHDSSSEEKMADDFVVEVQRTARYILSAKKKLDDYEKSSLK